MARTSPQVTISRKSKRLNRPLHLLAFVLTGGTSAVYTAGKAATNAGYNARTRELQRRAEAADDTFTAEDHERARRAGEAAMRRLSGEQ